MGRAQKGVLIFGSFEKKSKMKSCRAGELNPDLPGGRQLSYPLDYGYLVMWKSKYHCFKCKVTGSNPAIVKIFNFFSIPSITFFSSFQLLTWMVDPILEMAQHKRSPQHKINTIIMLQWFLKVKKGVDCLILPDL